MPSRLDPSLGRLLRTLRAAANLNQFELADLAQMHPATLSMIERGRRTPTPENLRALCVALPSLKAAIDAMVKTRG
jgi:transcriptional regulator with XRE-family HTH domain